MRNVRFAFFLLSVFLFALTDRNSVCDEEKNPQYDHASPFNRIVLIFGRKRVQAIKM